MRRFQRADIFRSILTSGYRYLDDIADRHSRQCKRHGADYRLTKCRILITTLGYLKIRNRTKERSQSTKIAGHGVRERRKKRRKVGERGGGARKGRETVEEEGKLAGEGEAEGCHHGHTGVGRG